MKYRTQLILLMFIGFLAQEAASVPVIAQPAKSEMLKGSVEDNYLETYSKLLMDSSMDFSFKPERDILKQSLKDGTAVTLQAVVDNKISALLPEINSDNPNLKSPKLEARQNQQITIAQTLDVALRQNLQIGITQEFIPITKWNYVAALGGFLPSINLDQNQDETLTRSGSPPKNVRATDLDLSAKLEYPIFQGGKVLFNSLATHSLYQAAKGQFAAARNDVLNTAVSDYYSLLTDQAILRIRLDSARFSSKQVRLYSARFRKAIDDTFDTLNDLSRKETITSSLGNFGIQNMTTVSNDLNAVDELELIKKSKDSVLKIDGLRIGQLKREQGEATEEYQEALPSWRILDRLTRLLIANQDLKRLRANDLSVFGKLSEDAINDAKPDALEWAAEERRVQSIIESLDSLQAVISIPVLKANAACILEERTKQKASIADPSPATTKRVALGVTEWERIGTSASGGTGAAFAPIFDAYNLAKADAIQLRSDLHAFNADTSENKKSTLIAKQRDRMMKQISAQIGNLQEKLQTIGRDEINVSLGEEKLLGFDPSNLDRLGKSKKQVGTESAKLLNDKDFVTAQTNALRASNEALDATRNALFFVGQLESALDSKLDTAKKVQDFISQMADSIKEMSKGYTSRDEKNKQRLERIKEVATELTLLANSSGSPAKLKRAAEDLKLHSSRLLEDMDYRHNQIIDLQNQVETAESVATEEAGASFQLDQWRTQLGSDIQDLITQIVTLRGASINLAALLNINPHVNLLVEDTLYQRARDLKDVRLAELVRKALTNRPELYQTDELRKAALANVGVAISQLLPTVSMFGSVAGAGTAPRVRELRADRSYAIGYDVAYNFTNLLLPSAASARSQGAVAHQAYLNFRQELITVLQQVHQSYVNVQTACIKIAAAAETASEASEQLVKADTPASRLNASASNLDVIQALNNRNTAMINLANNLSTYNTAQAQLLHDVGEMYPLNNYLQQ